MKRKLNSEAVIRDVDRRWIPRKKSRWFLERGAFFNQNHTLPDEDHEIAFKLFKEIGLEKGYKIEIKASWFRILLANLLLHWKYAPKNRRPVAIHLNEKKWKQKKNPYNVISDKIIGQMKTLAEHDYIKMKKGNNIKPNPRMARIWPTKKLLNYFPENGSTTWKPVQLVELRELDSKKRIKYTDTEKTKLIRSELEKINKVNTNADIWHPDPDIGKISVHLISIYRGSFDLYGRLHTSGPYGVQGLKAKQRRQLVINDQSVAELDFSALHPHLIYAHEGMQYFGDPYLKGGQKKVLRPMFKIMLMALLYAESKEKVFQAINHWFYKNPIEKKKLIKAGILPQPKWRWIKKGPKHKWKRKKTAPVKKYIMPLIDQFAEAHQPIDHHFLTGKKSGLRIMNKDASIALAVLKALTSEGVPCISMHDGFIVPAPYESSLRQLMQKKYYEATGGSRCPVKREYEPLESPKLIGIETRFEKVD